MRLNEKLIRPFQAPATVRNFSGSQVFLFQSSRQSDSEDSSEEEFNATELRARGKDPQPSSSSQSRVGDVQLLERVVKKDDNLNKLALQYGCKVEDIKRVNNFIQEQDFYALKSIKIPVKVNGLLTETSDDLLPLQTPGLLLEHSVSIDPENRSGDRAQIDQYFRGIDQNIETVTQIEIPSCTDPFVEPSNWSSREQKATCTGADYGIQWWKAVLLMLLIGIVLPVFYIVYFKTQQVDVVPGTSNTTDSVKISVNGSSVGRLNYAGQESSPTVHTTKQGFIPSGE
ncbi:lysM and putative peptidoglycan-binding domain-containing protein 4 [Ahaetulla prasina]|uniref:lysM and putative peptidoglycan-binding domain-containing protein 4 n=1 Tax=Ahaetulla prasina TaxID=499056 RepID=UPI00264A4C1E|nr:lysM and putative peptidoglycan-binding domain-containing protein 4 [Ahaetulla prasina]XP_058012825.1 lysM and putative peptidoglycan-binding domain-containing protein 4 [Ahaetulla prasina]XP_058012826.1 lysM and putative peptidoglycan-binding domain-containing protein 4 [Ahaetulla prasina]